MKEIGWGLCISSLENSGGVVEREREGERVCEPMKEEVNASY